MVLADPAATLHLRRGVWLMIAAMLAIPIVDGIAKHLTASYSPLFLNWVTHISATLIVLPIAAATHGRKLFPQRSRWLHLLRAALLVTAGTLFYQAIARIPLATAVSAYFVAPILAIPLSVLILKERMTLLKGVSLALGFIGSMVILRPGGALDVGLLFAFGSGVVFAFFMIVTRMIARDSDPLRMLAFQCAAGALLLTPQALVFWSPPQWSDAAFFAGLGVFAVASHLMSIAAYRIADASTLAPLVYIELIGATLIGYAVFGDVPDLPTMAGAACIVAAGLILLRRSAPKALSHGERVG
jgi:drug/metabolite transporter (DMT)-like permease